MDHSIGPGVEDYLVAVLAVTIAAIATALLWPLSETAPLALFYGAVAAAARRGGVGPRMAAILGSALFGAYFFLPPYGSFQLGLKSASAIVIFLGVSALIGWLAGPRRAASGDAPARSPWLERFAESIGEGAAIFDAQGRVVHLNPTAERLTGWSLDEARGRPSAEVFRIVDERTARPRDPAAEVLSGRTGGAPAVDSILVSRSGAEIPIVDAAAPMWEGAEKLAGVVMIVRELTQRPRGRESPRRTEELNQKIIDNSDVCIKLLDLDGRILMINDYGARLLEMDDPAEWIGRDLGEGWPRESQGLLREASRSAAAGRRARFEAFAPTAKGTPKWWDVSLAPILDAAGKPEKLLCIGRDVTERKRTEDALRVGEERYRALFSSVDEGFCIDEVLFDDEGRLVEVRVLEANPVFEALTGQRDVVGRTVQELGHGEETYWLALKARVALTGEPVRFSTLHPSFGDRWYEARIFRVGGDQSRKVAVLFRNITETVLAERERSRLVKGLESQRAELARLIENAPSFIAVTRGPNHVYELVNAEYQNTVGRRELLGRPAAEAIPELRDLGLIERMDRVYRTGEPCIAQEDEAYFDPGGNGSPGRRVANLVLQPMRDPDGSITGVLVHGVDITEEKRVEEALRAGEERYRALFNSIDEAFCVIEMIYDDQGRAIDLRYLEANPAFETHMGISDVVGRTLGELTDEEVGGWCEIFDRVARTGEPVRLANLNPAVVGRWFDLYAFRVDGDEGRKVAVIFRNITETVLADRERARLARELEGQRSELKRLIEIAPAFITVLRGPNHVIEFANAQCYALAGQRDAVGLPIAEAAPELQGQGYLELLDRVYRTGEPFVGQAMAVNFDREGTGDLTKRFINFVYQAMRDAEGAINGVFVHGVDVTEMVEAIEAVRESEIRFRQMAEAMPLAVWTTDPKGVPGLRNQKFLEYFGIREEDVVKKRWRDAVHPDDLESLNNAWAQSLRDGTPYEQEIRLKRASDGEYRWQLVHALPIRDEQGEIVRWIGANSDIDDYKRLSEALKQADQRKDEFLATLAHELRNPLSPIRTGLQILEMKPKEDVVASTVEMMSRQMGHMTSLIDDLMDLARVGSGKINLRKERVELRPIVGTALERIRPTIQERRHELTVKLAAEPIYLEADPTRIGQVISNLLTNAAKYTEPGGQIEISAGREGQEAVIRVKDSGVGLEHDMLEKVFEMFSQVGSSIKDSQGGLGIGLTVVKRLVELHDGRIEAKSGGLGLGSEFVVHLPIVAAGPERGDEPELVRDGGAPAGLRVLVVDDNRDSAESLARIVAMSGHQVRVAYNGEDALAAAESDPPDLVLLDIGLPGLNGYDVAERIRRDPRLREAKLVAVTGWGQSEDRRRSREAGFDLHLVKPVDLGVLQALLESGVEALKHKIADPGAPPSSNGADARSRPIPEERGA